MKHHLGIAACLICWFSSSFAQNDGSIITGFGNHAQVRNPSAVLEGFSDHQGFLAPRLTLAQRNAIVSPATSLLIFQTDNTPGYYYNSGMPGTPVWERLTVASGVLTGAGVSTRVAFWSGTSSLSSNSDLFWDNTNGRLGIGTAGPSDKLQINGGNILLSDVAGQTPYQIRSYSNGSSLWLISGSATTSQVVVGTAHDWDRQIAIDYTPGTVGAIAGVLNIGQTNKNNANFTHGITRFYTNGTEKMRIASDGDISLATKIAFRSSDAWLRLNPTNAFTSGTYIAGFFRADGGIASGGLGSAGAGTVTANDFINSNVGYRVNSLAPTGQYLRGNGTNFVANTIQVADVPTLNQNTTGNAATATNVSYAGVTNIPTRTDWSSPNPHRGFVAEQLSWKNFGNNHTIFDASAGTSPSGTAVNNTNAAIPWAATYPTLMGWNGTSTYGVRVDMARYAETAGSAPGDNLGNHTATTALNMTSNAINNAVQINSGGDHIEFMGNRTDDTSYEWMGFYSGATRQAIFLYDGAWTGANNVTNEFSLTAEGSNLLTLNSTGNHIALMPKGVYNVGIGTLAPASKLEVVSDALTLSGANLDMNRDGFQRHGISWYSKTYSSWSDYMAQAGQTSVGPHGNLTAPSGAYVNSWALRSYIENAGGYGWTFESAAEPSATPAVKFEIRASDGLFHGYGDGYVDGVLYAGASARMGTNIAAGYYQDATNGAYRSLVGAGTTNGYYFQTNAGGTTTMYVGLGGAYNGRVGIGTTTPNSALQLQGDNFATFGPNSTWAATLRIGGNGNVDNNASVAATNGNLHIDAANGAFATYLNFYRGTSGIQFGNGAGAAIGTISNIGYLSMNNAINTGVGYRVGGAAANGAYLRGDGTNFVANTIQPTDIPYGNSSTGGPRAQGNFGQFQPHGTTTDFNSVPGYWGWNYVQGTTNAPNATSSQWYRGVFSLGDAYPARGAGGYSLELAYPRHNHTAAGVWMRTVENGAIGGWSRIDVGSPHTHTWSQVTSKPAAWLDAANLIQTNNNFNNSVPSGFYQSSGAANAPGGSWYNMINVRQDNTANDHGFQIAASYYDEYMYSRTYQGGTGANNGSFTPWARHLTNRPGDWNVASNSTGTDYTTSTIELRESNYTNNGSAQPPRLGFHWGGVVASQIAIESDGTIAIRNNPGTGYEKFRCYTIRTNGIIEPSDARLKNNISTIPNALDKVMAIRGVTYNWRQDLDMNEGFETGKQYGLIAQELEAVIPELVDTDKEGWKAVEYSHLVPVLIEAMKEQQATIAAQQRVIDGNKDDISFLKQYTKELEARIEGIVPSADRLTTGNK